MGTDSLKIHVTLAIATYEITVEPFIKARTHQILLSETVCFVIAGLLILELAMLMVVGPFLCILALAHMKDASLSTAHQLEWVVPCD